MASRLVDNEIVNVSTSSAGNNLDYSTRNNVANFYTFSPVIGHKVSQLTFASVADLFDVQGTIILFPFKIIMLY